jgi:hypothetical protein
MCLEGEQSPPIDGGLSRMVTGRLAKEGPGNQAKNEGKERSA